MNIVTMEKIVNLCKNRGFVYPGSEIYGGMGNTWDFGPLGVELKNNIKKAWWKRFVQESPNTYGLDCAILMNSKVWEASGHVKGFSDPKMDCKKCKQRFRADTLIEGHAKGNVVVDTMTHEDMEKYIADNNIKCPHCGSFDWTNIREFNLMFETSRGTINGQKDIVYLRPETCQGEYINFANVQRSLRAKVPFAIAQIGKTFRNEVTPGNFIFRTIEFEQMELQKFCKDADAHNFWLDYKKQFMQFAQYLGLSEDKLRFKDHDKLAFYAKEATDIQYNFPIGWSELNGIHNRSNYDLTQHSKFSGKALDYLDPYTNEKFIPWIIESSVSPERYFLATMCEAYNEEKLDDGELRIVLKLKPFLAPYKVAILPLQKNLNEKAQEVFKILSKQFMCDYDESGSIGKRYRRQDEIGTPFCVTIDFDTLENDTVTIRDRDTMKQERLKISQLIDYVVKRVEM